jgi:hypothetical protein
MSVWFLSAASVAAGLLLLCLLWALRRVSARRQRARERQVLDDGLHYTAGRRFPLLENTGNQHRHLAETRETRSTFFRSAQLRLTAEYFRRQEVHERLHIAENCLRFV